MVHYEEGEDPIGLYMSAETNQLLHEMGGALDMDAVPIVTKSRNN
jgi:hypothetical protein